MKRQRAIELDRVKKTMLNIDWDDALGDEEVPELEIIATDKIPPREPTLSGYEPAVSVRSFRDNELDDHLKRQRSLLTRLGDKLADKGEKIRNRIGELEYEKQRRMFQQRTKMVLSFFFLLTLQLHHSVTQMKVFVISVFVAEANCSVEFRV